MIDALKTIYPLTSLLENLNLAKSSFYYHRSQSILPDKYANLRALLKEMFIENRSAYGYRRMYAALKKQHIIVSEKVIRRIMKEEKLTVRSIKKKKYSSYAGEITPATPNHIQRNFKSEKPNEKWLTDITEFRISAGKIYLSPIIDCFDGAVVSWTISTQQNAELVNSLFDQSLETPSGDSKPTVHSDRGAHYRCPGWIKRIKTNGLTQSRYKKILFPRQLGL